MRTRGRRIAGAIGMVICLQVALAGSAVADIGTAGGLDPEDTGGATMTVGLSVADPGGSAVYTEGGSDAPSPVRYIAIPMSEGDGLSVTYLCAAGGAGVVVGDIPWGWIYIVVAIDTATGEELSRTTTCVPIADASVPTRPPPPTVPVAPSIVEIWRSVGLPPPELHLNPGREGVTGLATWIWSGGPTTATVDATIREWSVTGTAQLVAWNIDPGDTTGTVATAGSGDRDHHALDHTYEVKGSYPLSITAVWVAQVAMSGPGLPPTPVPIGSALLSTTRQYQVVEVVPVLLP